MFAALPQVERQSFTPDPIPVYDNSGELTNARKPPKGCTGSDLALQVHSGTGVGDYGGLRDLHSGDVRAGPIHTRIIPTLARIIQVLYVLLFSTPLFKASRLRWIKQLVLDFSSVFGSAGL